MIRAQPCPTCRRVAVPSLLPPPLPQGRGRVRLHVGYLGIPAIFQLVCHSFLSIKFAFSGYSRLVEARSCRSDRRETGTQIGLIGKTENCIGYQSRKPVSIFCENRKPNAKKTENPQTAMTTKPKKRSFLAQKPKNRSKTQPKLQNRKS